MGDLSLHFNRREFSCRCSRCKQDAVDHKLVEVLERLRRFTDAPIAITSGNRCHEYNLAVGGAPGSMHVWSKAADIQTKGWSPEKIYEVLDEWYPEEFGIGLYRTWVHIDVRPLKARWDKR